MKIIETIFKSKKDSKEFKQYKSPFDIPVSERTCNKCAFENTNNCSFNNCFKGTLQKIEMRNK